jgi:hypothetical protein
MVATSFNPVNDIILAIVFIGGVLVYAKGRIPQQTVKNLQDLTSTYERRIAALESELKEDHQIQLQNVSAISDLQGQVKVYKELPLQEIADGIKKVSESNDKIVTLLTATAQINAEDRDILTNQNLHIKTEVHKEMNK